jgi:nitrous oxide reductase accessory protein NosL
MTSHIEEGGIKMRNVFISLLLLVFSIISPLNPFAAAAADGVENPKACKQCGMDRTVFAQSRMLIVYADGTTVGACSIHCAAAELKQNSDRQVKSLMVADYTTLALIDAKTATWVIGGRKQGVMTSAAKWAFAREEDAREFMQENGGEISPFDAAMKAAEEEVGEKAEMTHEHRAHMGHDMSHMDMGPGAQMLFNQGSATISPYHPAGCGSHLQFMHMNMSGLRDARATFRG